MFLAFCGAARAAVVAVPADAVDLAAAVDQVRSAGEASTITVAAGTPAGADVVDVSGLTLRIEGQGGRASLPPLRGEGASLTLAAVRLEGAGAACEAGLVRSSLLCVTSGDLTLDDVELAPTWGEALAALDTDVDAADVALQSGPEAAGVHLSTASRAVVATFVGLDTTAAGRAELTVEGGALGATLEVRDSTLGLAAGGYGSAIQASDATVRVTDSVVADHVCYDKAAVDLIRSSAELVGVEFRDNACGLGGALAAQLDGQAVTVSNSSFQGDDAMWFSGTGSVAFTAVALADAIVTHVPLTIDSSVVYGRTTQLHAVGADVQVRDSHLCVGAGQGLWAGVYGGQLTLERTVVSGAPAPGTALVDGAWDDDNVPSMGSLTVRDSTLVGLIDTTLVAGALRDLTVINTLVAGPGLDLGAEVRGAATVDWNLWSDSAPTLAGGALPAGWGAHDLVGVDPAFEASFDPTVCGSLPTLAADSPAIDAGDPASVDTVDGGRSDIGAVDHGSRSGGDTADTGDTGDTGPADTGDTDDTDAGARDGCGCAASRAGLGPAALLAASFAVLLRGRRRTDRPRGVV